MTLPVLRAAAALSLALVATPAAAEWREASTDHFLIYADASEAWTRTFAEKLERFDSAMRIGRKWRVTKSDSANRVVVYVVDDVDAIQKLHARGRASSVAGFYVPRINSVAFVPRTSGTSLDDLRGETILFHEYAHHLMWRNEHIAFPKWYSEGFAEMFAAARIGTDGRVEVGRHAGQRSYSLMNANSLPIEKLLEGDEGGNGDLFYGRAWLLTHMMTFDPARAGQLQKYLTLVSSGTPNLDAARTAFGDLRALNRAIDTYIDRSLKFLTYPADRVSTGAITLRTLGLGEAAMMPVRLRSDRGVDEAEAKLVVVDARRRAAPFPNDAAVQVALAEAEYDAGNDAEAEAAVDRALAANPQSQDAMLYKGRVLVRRAGKAGATDAATWRQARSWYAKATRLQPEAAEPLALFYESFGEQGIAPTANAAAAAQKAFELAPQDPNLRFQAAHLMLAEGRVAEARVALIPLAFDPHDRGQTNFATKLVKMIDAGEPAEKIAAARPDKVSERAADGKDDDPKKGGGKAR